MQFVASGPAPQIPKPKDADALFDALSDAELMKIGMEGFGQIQAAISEGDRPRVSRLLKIAWKKGWITEQKHNAIKAAISATIDDPDWPVEVPAKPRLVELAEENSWTDNAGRKLTSIAAETIDAILGRM